MKTYRQREKQGNKVTESNKGPDETKIKVCTGFVGFGSDLNVKLCFDSFCLLPGFA